MTTKVKREIIECLYSHLKNSKKKLTIVCDWDEVIQSHEPYALWLSVKENNNLAEEDVKEFPKFFKWFWRQKDLIEYFPFGSKTNIQEISKIEVENSKQIDIKNSPSFYQQAPFLTIAKELLLLIKDDKIEKLIFLSACDKRKFPNGDKRKIKIFEETFLVLASKYHFDAKFQLISFENESEGANKASWIAKNIQGVDAVIDDNPIICGNVIASEEVVEGNNKVKVFAPHYKAIEEKHLSLVRLIKTSVSDLTKGDFKI